MSEKLIQSRFMVVGCLLFATVAFVSGEPRSPDAPGVDQFETRCGWLSNPTPANMWLFDSDGQWIIGRQGGYQMEGDWDLPDFKPRQWVLTNTASYGYGCACLRLRVNKETREVLEIESSRARPLAACRRDRSLKRWKFK